MRKLKRICIFIFVFLMMLFACACVKKIVPDPVIEDELTISGPSVIGVGEHIMLTINLEGDANWESSDENVLSVDAKGVASGISEGSATVTCTLQDKVARIEIKVNNEVVEIGIVGKGYMLVSEEYKFNYTLSKEVKEDGVWESSNEEILRIDSNGNAKALKAGEVTISFTIINNVKTYKVIVLDEFFVSIEGKDVIEVNETYGFDYKASDNNRYTVTFESSDEHILSISKYGLATGVSEGTATITLKAYIEGEDEVYATDTLEVTVNSPLSIIINGESETSVGLVNTYKIITNKSGIDYDFECEITNNLGICTIDGNTLYVLCTKKGDCKIILTSKKDSSISAELDLKVNEMVQKITYTDEEIARVNAIIANMSLEQKVGQMLIFSTSSETVFSTSTENAIKDYHLGNTIYMGGNCSNPETLAKMSNAYQEAFVKYNTVPGLISTDQEGGSVARIKAKGTHFLSQMGLAATNDPNYAYLEGVAMGKELQSFGINVDYAPVMDVNNNPNNPIIGIRSYSDDPIKASRFGDMMLKGLGESGVIATAKHFPGHGNTSTDSHYGLPTITSSIDELYKVELAPFISAIANGIGAIMTTHIIFSCIDSEYPATLSNKVLTGLLRDELKFEGIIVTDGMEMGAITNNFGSEDVSGPMAVKAGADMLLSTSISGAKRSYNGIMNAYNNGEITLERIEESVRRILLTKLRYGILDDYIKSETYNSKLIKDNNELALDIAKHSITNALGNFKLEKNDKILVVCTKASFTLDSSLESQCLGAYLKKYLKTYGYSVEFMMVDNNISDDNASSVLSNLSSYDKIILGFSNVHTNSYSRTINFVNNVLKTRSADTLVVAFQTPYDALSYKNLTNYMCTYSYQEHTIKALCMGLNNEYEFSGVLPIKIN